MDGPAESVSQRDFTNIGNPLVSIEVGRAVGALAVLALRAAARARLLLHSLLLRLQRADLALALLYHSLPVALEASFLVS